MYFKSILCISFAAVTLTLGNQSQDDVQANDDASYEFGYDVHNPVSNDIKSHHEIRDGKNVLGFYTFKEADGTIRIVKYKVTPDSGFEAVVEKLKPEPLNGNSIDGQEAAQSTHGASTTVVDPKQRHSNQNVAGVADSPHINHNSQDNIPASDQNHPGRYRNPYIIRSIGHNQQSQLPTVYNRQWNHQNYNNPRRRQQFFQQPNRELQVQEAVEQHSHRFAPRANGQVGHYTDNADQLTGPIVYIDGIPYIDDIGYTDQLRKGKIPNNVYIPDLDRTQNPQYAVQENPEDNVNKEANPKVEDRDTEPDKEEYEKNDEDDYENAEYEEEDDGFIEDDDESDATEFYEENVKLINEQQKQYDELKKAYEEDVPTPKTEEKPVEVQQSEVALEVQQPEAQ